MKKMMSVLLAGMVGLVVGIVTATAESGYGKQKVVYHVNYDDPKQQKAALRNIQNHINAVGKDDIDLRVVMHGDGLSMLLLPEALGKVRGFKHVNAEPQIQASIDNLKIQGVRFNVCSNTVKGRKVTMDQLYDAEQADVVASGVAELAHLQAQGFVYIKP